MRESFGKGFSATLGALLAIALALAVGWVVITNRENIAEVFRGDCAVRVIGHDATVIVSGTNPRSECDRITREWVPSMERVQGEDYKRSYHKEVWKRKGG